MSLLTTFFFIQLTICISFNTFVYPLRCLPNFFTWPATHNVKESHFQLTLTYNAARRLLMDILHCYKITGLSSISVAQNQHNLICFLARMSPCKEGDQAQFQEPQSQHLQTSCSAREPKGMMELRNAIVSSHNEDKNDNQPHGHLNYSIQSLLCSKMFLQWVVNSLICWDFATLRNGG